MWSFSSTWCHLFLISTWCHAIWLCQHDTMWLFPANMVQVLPFPTLHQPGTIFFLSHQNKCHLLLLATWCHVICCSHQLGASAICYFAIDQVPSVSSCQPGAGDIWLICCSTSHVGTRLCRSYQHQHTHKNTLQYYLSCYLLAQGKNINHG